MKIFIVGIKSFIGSNLATKLREKNHFVVGSTSSLDNNRQKSNHLVQIKLGDKIDSNLFSNFDCVLYCAHDLSKGSQQRNVDGTVAILEASLKAGVKNQIFISSYSAQPNAQSEYGKTKFILEKIFLEKNLTVIRPGLVIGDGGLFSRMYKLIKWLPIVPILDQGKGSIPFIGIKDLSLIIIDILEKQRSGPFNIFHEGLANQKSLVQAIKKRTVLKAITISLPKNFILQIFSFLSKLKIKLPLSEENLKGYYQNQNVQLTSDLKQFFPKEKALELIIEESIR